MVMNCDAGATIAFSLPMTTNATLFTDKHNKDKPVGDWISASSPNFVAMATTVGPEVQWIDIGLTTFPGQSCRAESATTGGDVVM